VALVGESGSGKSVVAQSIMGILPRIARIDSGEIVFRDPRAPGTELDLSRLKPAGRKMRQIRGGRISIIFQEPMTALSPLHTIGNQVGEALRRAQGRSPGAASQQPRPWLQWEHVTASDARPAVCQSAQRRGTGAVPGEKRCVHGTDRGPHQQVGGNLPLGEGLQHPDLDGAEAAAPGQDECGGHRADGSAALPTLGA